MSQSETSTGDGSRQAASQALDNLGLMVRHGKSFSGRERNGCFLNLGRRPSSSAGSSSTGGPTTTMRPFANIAAASGIDYADDARAVASVDWDHDGDLDLWFSNRNAPRLRLLRNDVPTDNGYVSIRLQGNGIDTNRDAIGARVEVVAQTVPHGENRESAGSPPGARFVPRSIQTLRAGDGFLGQSSKWLHFGLGPGSTIERVIVHWPTVRHGDRGREEIFEGVALNGRYTLGQGSGEAVETPARKSAVSLAPSSCEALESTAAARVPVVTLIRMPRLVVKDPVTSQVTSTGSGSPVLVNFWASWCQPCVQELAEFTRRAAEIRDAGLSIIAVSVDGVGESAGESGDAVAWMRKIQFPFASVPGSADLLRAFQDFDDALTAVNRPLPLPSSFLISPDGNLTVMYKGPLSVDQLLADAALPEGTLAERWVRAAPLPGRSIDRTGVITSPESYEARTHFRIAERWSQLNEWSFAAHHYGQALEYMPHDHGAQNRYGLTLLQLDHVGEALAHFDRILVSRADDAELQRIIAWLLATSSDDNLRDGQRALELAQRASALAGDRQVPYLDTLAAALAETGDYAAAVETAQRAVELATAEGRSRVAAQIGQRLLSYQQQRPYRSEPGGGAFPR